MSSDTNNPRGRPKGSVNKLTQELLDKLEAEPGEHPAVLLKRIANDPKTDRNIVVQAATALLPYMSPKLRQVELQGALDINDDREGVAWKSVPPPRPDNQLSESERKELDGDAEE